MWHLNPKETILLFILSQRCLILLLDSPLFIIGIITIWWGAIIGRRFNSPLSVEFTKLVKISRSEDPQVT